MISIILITIFGFTIGIILLVWVTNRDEQRQWNLKEEAEDLKENNLKTK
jgi:type II secretory pathway pseudopilin PulG